MHQMQFNNALLKVALEYYPENTCPFQNCLVVGMQHMLGTTVDMFKVMKQLGLKHAVVGSKLYSDHQACIAEFKNLGFHYIGCQEPIGHGLYQESIVKDIHQIWECALRLIKNTSSIQSIIVLDDGADLLLNIPNEIYRLSRLEGRLLVGIEQTRGGCNRNFFNGLPLPMINVAGAAIKLKFEYRWVAKEVVRILTSGLLQGITLELGRTPRIGIIGYGVMGLAIAHELSLKEFAISVHDPKITSFPQTADPEVTHLANVGVLISGADVIIGCTGTDVTAHPAVFDALHYSPTPKWLVSTSSKDVEFNFLLHKCQQQVKQRYTTPDVLQTVVYRNHYSSLVSVLRGGFPINFQNTLHCVPPEKIWPTRASLLLAALMAVKQAQALTKSSASAVYKLDPHLQMLIYHHYTQVHPADPQLKNLQMLSDQELCRYFCAHSQGELLHQERQGYDAIDPTLEAMPSHAYLKDLKGIYLACNDPFIKASGLGSRRAIIGKTDRQLWPASSRALSFIDTQVLETQEQITLVETVETNEGVRSYLSIKKPFFDQDKLVGIIGNSIPLS